MLLVADSGATKTAWILIDQSGYPREFSTMGFSPLFHSEQDILIALGGNAALAECAAQVTDVRYFGAGCSSPDRNEKIYRALSHFFAHATHIAVEHDLLGSVWATCGTSSGISCILGTGSNACYYHGEQIHEAVPSLDYILGDEGSGAYFGKRIVANFLYKRLPQDLYQAFADEYQLDKEIALNRVYRQPHPKVWLASFAKFFKAHEAHPYIHALLLEGLGEFLDTRVVIFPNYREVPVHFVGSIAHHFQTALRQACEQRGISVGKIIKEPIYDLTEFIRLIEA
jgi:N-acetylglucosamine kinase-like BadF-type ATPase